MNIFSRLHQRAIAHHQVQQLTGLAYWRHLIFTSVFCFGLLAVFPAYIAGQIIAVNLGRWEVFTVNTVLYGIALMLVGKKRLAYPWRFGIGVHLFFILGAVLCVVRGPLSAGPIWLFAFPILSAILLGKRFAFYALGLNAAVLLGILLGLQQGSLGSWATASISPSFWVMYSLNHLCISAVATISLVILMEGLERTLDQGQELMRSLAASNQKLKEQIVAYLEANWERQIITSALDKSPIATLIFRDDGTLRYANQSAVDMLGYNGYLQPGTPLKLYQHWPIAFQTALEEARAQGKADCEIVVKNTQHSRLPLAIHLHRFECERRPLLCAFALDITERKENEQQLRYLAYHDRLTGLPNRALFVQELEQLLQRLRGDASLRFALLFADLDKFKTVNDSLGHRAGDILLQQVGHRLAASVVGKGLVSRLGGDEFAFLISEYGNEQQLWALVEQILQRLQEPIFYEQHQIMFTASIGIVLEIDPQTTAEFLLRDADIAMYQAKFTGGNRAVVLDTTMRQQFMQRFGLERDLQRAIEAGEFRLYYQPIVCLFTQQVMGFEALIRWQHPERGLLAPENFIGIAEEGHLMIPLGEWVMEQACTQLQHWHNLNPGLHELTISVNLSAVQFQHSDLAGTILAALQRHRLAPRSLKLEITESIMMTHTQEVLHTISVLKAQGMQIALDDFGTGYSSLACLQQFPINTLKIDKSFILPLLEQPQAISSIRVILSLARSLAIDVIAEGVETAKHARTLRELGCPLVQGWFYGKPLSAPETEAMLLAAQSGNATPAPWQLTASGLYFRGASLL